MGTVKDGNDYVAGVSRFRFSGCRLEPYTANPEP